MTQSNAQTEYNIESPITYEHLTLIRPKTPFRPVVGSKVKEQ